MRKSSRIIFASIITASCWLLYTFSTDVYMYTDNVDVALVINGYFGNPLCQYQHPLFCILVNLLSRMFPSVDMYTAVVHVFVAGELFLLLYILSSNIESNSFRAFNIIDYAILLISIMIAFFLSAGLNLWRANYTIQASSFLFTGLLALYQGEKKDYIIKSIIATLYISMGYMLRKEV